MTTFKALFAEKKETDVALVYRTAALDDLSEGDTLVKVAYSGINYKDALASVKNGGVIRSYPMIPGIDFSGTVIATDSSQLSEGTAVLATGYGLGVTHTGGFSELARVPAEWLIPLPENLSLKNSMILGTAGLTAALAINKLEQNGLKETKDAAILVTGATGGVGSLALTLLQSLGYTHITALSRKKDTADTYLQSLGASAVITPEDIVPDKVRPLRKQQFDFVIDTVGGDTVAHLLPVIRYGGSIALCGNAAGIAFQTTVLPFILRGVNLLGIDSVNISRALRIAMWQRLAACVTPEALAHISRQEVGLAEAEPVIDSLLAGTHTGRTLIRMD